MSSIRRGYVPEDERDFSDKMIPLLQKALSDICELLNRGYEVKPASTFVGNHYQLSERQRLALARAASSDENIALRQSKLIPVPDSKVSIDGLNLIITLETALSDTTLYRCTDGTVRDLAAMRGTYRIIDHTHTAVKLIFDKLTEIGAQSVVFYLDAPVSNTGRLKTLILEISANYPMNTECELVPNADFILKKLPNIVTADAIILNECISWLNLGAQIIDENIPSARIIPLKLKRSDTMPIPPPPASFDHADYGYEDALENYCYQYNKKASDLTDEDNDEIMRYAGNHIGFFLTWLIRRGYLGEMHKENPDALSDAEKVKNGEMLGVDFLMKYCDGRLLPEDMSDDILPFVISFYEESYLRIYADFVITELNDLPLEFTGTWEDYLAFEPTLDRLYKNFTGSGQLT